MDLEMNYVTGRASFGNILHDSNLELRDSQRETNWESKKGKDEYARATLTMMLEWWVDDSFHDGSYEIPFVVPGRGEPAGVCFFGDLRVSGKG